MVARTRAQKEAGVYAPRFSEHHRGAAFARGAMSRWVVPAHMPVGFWRPQDEITGLPTNLTPEREGSATAFAVRPGYVTPEQLCRPAPDRVLCRRQLRAVDWALSV